MRILNTHERTIAARADEVGSLLDGLGLEAGGVGGPKAGDIRWNGVLWHCCRVFLKKSLQDRR